MKLKMSKEVDLGKEPIGHLLLILALPSITSQVVNALYNMVDRMYIGHIPEIGSGVFPVFRCLVWRGADLSAERGRLRACGVRYYEILIK